MILENISKKIDKLIAADEFSGNILLSKNNTIVYSKVCGFSNKDFEIYNNIDTMFNIASIGKVFTGVAITQLAQKKLLNLEDSLENYIDNTMVDTDILSSVKLIHLLTHTSGFGDYFQKAYNTTYHSEFRNLEDYWELLKNSVLSFTPGSQWSYSNSGFVLLGFIIEKVSKMSYYDYINQNIFTQCSMTNSSFICEDEPAKNRAIGYSKVTKDDGSLVFILNSN